MSEQDRTGDSAAEEQEEVQGEGLENENDTDTGTDEAEEQEASEEESSDEAEADEDEAEADDEADSRFKDQQKRAKKAEEKRDAYKQRLIDAGLDPETGKKKETPAPKKGEQNDDRVTAAENRANEAVERAQRAELRSMGITHPDDLALVQKAAKELGIDPVEAADRKYVKAEIEELRERRKTRDNTASPKKGADKSGTKDVSKLADKVAAGGELPADPALSEKVQQELARRSQSRA